MGRRSGRTRSVNRGKEKQENNEGEGKALTRGKSTCVVEGEAFCYDSRSCKRWNAIDKENLYERWERKIMIHPCLGRRSVCPSGWKGACFRGRQGCIRQCIVPPFSQRWTRMISKEADPSRSLPRCKKATGFKGRLVFLSNETKEQVTRDKRTGVKQYAMC